MHSTLTSLLVTGAVLAQLSLAAWWLPAVGTTWQYEIGNANPTDTSLAVTAFDIDLENTSAAQISAFRAAGKKVICYFSAGSYEPWRSDAGLFTAADKGAALPAPWQNESWFNTNSANVRSVMATRINLAHTKRCDGIEPDNIDAFSNSGGGFNLTAADAINYLQYLSATAHNLGLAIGLKNAGSIIPSVISYVDYAVNEQCVEYKECANWVPFITAGKPVFNVEYPQGDTDKTIAQLTTAQQTASCNSPTKFSSILKLLDLDATIYICPPAVVDVPAGISASSRTTAKYSAVLALGAVVMSTQI